MRNTNESHPIDCKDVALVPEIIDAISAVQAASRSLDALNDTLEKEALDRDFGEQCFQYREKLAFLRTDLYHFMADIVSFRLY